jgi:adenylate cyclase
MNKIHSNRHEKQVRWQGRIPIPLALVTSVGLLMLVTVGSVIGIGAWTARKNTITLLGNSAYQTVSSVSKQIETYLRPAEYQTKFIAERIVNGEATPDKQQEFGKILAAALAAAPQIEAILFIKTNFQSFGVGQNEGKISVNLVDYSNDPYIIEAMRMVAIRPGWGPPVWREKFKKTYLNYAYPIIVEGKFIGAMVAVVSIKDLSRFVDQSGLTGRGRQFLLYGQDHVLAHTALKGGYAGRSENHPLPELSQFSDPVLSAIWQTEDRYPLEIPLPSGTRGHVLDISGKQFIFLYQYLAGFGSEPIIAGVYYRLSDVGQELQRLLYSLIAGLVALAVSLVIVVFIAFRITKPIVHFSVVAKRVRYLEIAKVGFLPSSILRELNDQSKAFNAMLQALLWFELYVPKKIVDSLIKRNIRVGDDISDAQEITVMFTDIVGFSSACENMTAREVASFVNQHFTLVASCIEAEEGIVDKFIGDSVMAFWGAPDPQDDSAARACRAALAIRAKIHTDNIERLAKGKAPVHMRIGIHTGTAIVGNIGSPGRLNYTIIGDTVNTGQRLEQLGKEVYPPDTEVSCLISENTAALLGNTFDTNSVGQFTLKGHKNSTEVFKLL